MRASKHYQNVRWSRDTRWRSRNYHNSASSYNGYASAELQHYSIAAVTRLAPTPIPRFSAPHEHKEAFKEYVKYISEHCVCEDLCLVTSECASRKRDLFEVLCNMRSRKGIEACMSEPVNIGVRASRELSWCRFGLGEWRYCELTKCYVPHRCRDAVARTNEIRVLDQCCDASHGHAGAIPRKGMDFTTYCHADLDPDQTVLNRPDEHTNA